jgi:L-glyceraldehyde 3-phosphate reductase
MALAWILKDDYVTSVIVGASSTAQLEKNLKALESPTFTPEELEEIEKACNI